MNIAFNFDELATDKAAKKVAQLFSRAGSAVAQTTADPRIRRTAGVTYREMNFLHTDGQTTTIRIKSTGDVSQVLINGSLQPIKNQDNAPLAVAEISKALEANRAKFQAKQAKVRAELPKGLKTAAPKIEVALKTRVDELDSEIAAKTAQRDELVAELGPVMDAVEPVEQVEPVESVEPVENVADAVVLDAAKWSADVDTDWHPKEGFFTQSADEIASGLKAASEDLAQAMARLNFYINRAGDNLSGEDKARLESAKDKLSALYGDKAMDSIERDPADLYAAGWKAEDGTVMYYTGKAGTGFSSKDLKDAFFGYTKALARKTAETSGRAVFPQPKWTPVPVSRAGKVFDNVAVVEGLKECDADVNVRITVTDDREAIVQAQVLTASGDPAVTGTPLVDSDGLVTEQTIDDKFEDEFEILEPGEDSDVPELVLT